MLPTEDMGGARTSLVDRQLYQCTVDPSPQRKADQTLANGKGYKSRFLNPKAEPRPQNKMVGPSSRKQRGMHNVAPS